MPRPEAASRGPDVLQELRLALPDWMPAFLASVDAVQVALEDRMRLAIALAGANVEHGTGGPFGAAVFERDSGALLSVGVNLVIARHCSSAHAEIVALSLAQAKLGSFTLARAPRPLQLVSSAEPCAMCLGAIAWSGVGELVTGATDADVRAIGFDEGAKPPGWQAALAAHGIRVVPEIAREQARDVLNRYRRSGGPIYNG